MLILTRKPGETVVIGDDVRITVLAVRGSQIKLGIDAPREVRVNREEVLEREIQARETHAAESGAGYMPGRHTSPELQSEEWSGGQGDGPGPLIEGGGRPLGTAAPAPASGRRQQSPGAARSGRGVRRRRRHRERPKRDSEAA